MNYRVATGLSILTTILVVACGDSAQSGGAGGGAAGSPATGGAGGGGAASEGGFTTADHPDQPQVITYGGAVLASPKVVAIVYDDDALTPTIDDFLPAMAASSYWTAVTSEYGVGPLTVLPSIHRTDAPPASPVNEQVLLDDLDANTSGADPAWGPADPDTIYLFVLPAGVLVDEGDGELCCDAGYDGYHYEALLSGPVSSVPYAVTCQCPGLDGPDVDDIAQMTIVISHELAESATDPYLYSDVAYVEEDPDHLAWTVTTGGEVTDMCDYNLDAYVVDPEAGYSVSRSWSNEAALAGDNPCAPFPIETPYFNSAPILEDDVSFYDLDGFQVDSTGVTIPVGSTKSVDLALFSNAPTSKPWNVTVFDWSELNGGPKLLDLSLDATSGQNGDTLALQIHVLAQDADAEAEFFVVQSDLDGEYNLSIGAVTN